MLQLDAQGARSCRPKFRIHVHALSRGKDLIKARREALVFPCTKAGRLRALLYTCTQLCVRESSGHRDFEWLGSCLRRMKETRLARTQQAAIDSARKQFSLDIGPFIRPTTTGRCISEIFDRICRRTDKVRCVIGAARLRRLSFTYILISFTPRTDNPTPL